MYDAIIYNNNFIENNQRLSKELQIGKAGEHFVVTDLLLKGYSAFLSEQGLPYDVLVDSNSRLFKVQVKSTLSKINYAHVRDAYRFGLKRGKKQRKFLINEIDIFAFVFLDRLEVIYLGIKDLISLNGNIKQCVEFRSKNDTNNLIYKNTKMKFIEDYCNFDKAVNNVF